MRAVPFALVAALALALALAGKPLPLAAQDDPLPEAAPEAEGESLDEGMELLGRGAELFLRGLMEEIGPQLRDLDAELRGLAEGVGPMIAELIALIDEIDAYHPPERLPNGDIILRRKDPSEVEELPPPEEGQIDI